MDTTNIPTRVDRRKAVDAQTDIRLKLLANGYIPLPATEKRVLQKGWPQWQPTEKDIRAWGESLDKMTTAIRIEGDLVAVDIDVNDFEVCDAILDMVFAVCPALAHAPMRYGKGAKVMLLARVDEKFGIINSHVMYDDDERDHRVECFAGGTTRYFTCFGHHTEGDLTAEGLEVLVEYEWYDGLGSPLTLRPEDLPVIPYTDVVNICLQSTEIMESFGWKPGAKSQQGEVSNREVSDLTDDMLFHCDDGVTRTLENLHEHADGNCSASWHEPGAGNRSRCAIRIHDDGVVKVIDYDEYVWHFPEGHTPKNRHEIKMDSFKGGIGALGALLQAKAETDERFAPKAVEPEEDDQAAEDEIEELINELVDDWAYWPSGNSGEEVVSLRRPAKPSMSMRAFQNVMAKHSFEVVGKNKGVTVVNPVSLWVKRADRVEIDGYDYVPEIDTPLVHKGDQVLLNRYLPPVFDAEPHKLDLWHDFLRHLIPVEDERAWFINWLAHKLQFPSSRGAGILFVSAGTQGTGRGTLYKLLAAIVGEQNTSRVTVSQILGKGSQAQYTEWMIDTLFGFCDEITMNDVSFTGMREAYENVKDLIDPSPRPVTAKIKYGKDRKTLLRTSILMATNHYDALPIPSDDRRIAVLSTPRALAKDPKLEARINDIREGDWVDPGFARAVREHLMSLDTIQRDFMFPIMTSAKEEMAHANEGRITPLLREYLQDCHDGFMIVNDVVAKVEQLVVQRALGDRVKSVVATEVGTRLRNGFEGWHTFTSRPRIDPLGRPTICYYGDEDEAEERYAELMRLPAEARLRAVRRS